tara:strand:- start:1708 stop:3483 length:1776 start_codon:yes stop_codon:yes gene_type:complete
MYTLGISAYFHDSAAALTHENKLIYAVQEERFSRKKNDNSFPKFAIQNILESNKLDLNKINNIVFYEKPFIKFERLIETYLRFAPYGFSSFKKSIPVWLKEKLMMKRTLIKELNLLEKNNNYEEKIKFSDHHLSHAASTYFLSNFDEALIVTMDAVGEWTTTSIMIGKEYKIEFKEEINFPHSLGLLYSAFTYFCGFEVNSGEYKLMGLAPYGKSKYKDLILNELINIKEDGSFNLNQNYFDYCTGLRMTNKKFETLFKVKPRELGSKFIDEIYIDLAASIQDVLELCIIKLLKHFKQKYKINNLCLAGGVSLNCAANGKIYREKIFDKIFITPASGDAGGAAGAALAYDFSINKPMKKVSYENKEISYLGTLYNDKQIEDFLVLNNIKFQKLTYDEITTFVSEKISKNKIIGWFQGRMEFGPRALGARSILADPRTNNMQEDINFKIKFREGFRPFAPIVLNDYVDEWFECDEESPFMLNLYQLKKEKILNSDLVNKAKLFNKLKIKKSEIPAVTHVNFTSRLQTLKKDDNKILYDLISKFYKITNIPILVNTSFNINGEPIVESVEDAYKCFQTTNLDYLVLENFLIEK